MVTYTYDTWGQVTSITGSHAATVGQKNPYRYRGYRYDSETGLYYLLSRYYDPVTSRFLNADVLLNGGDELLGYNRFIYGANNPIMNIDPTGHYVWPFIKRDERSYKYKTEIHDYSNWLYKNRVRLADKFATSDDNVSWSVKYGSEAIIGYLYGWSSGGALAVMDKFSNGEVSRFAAEGVLHAVSNTIWWVGDQVGQIEWYYYEWRDTGRTYRKGYNDVKRWITEPKVYPKSREDKWSNRLGAL